MPKVRLIIRRSLWTIIILGITAGLLYGVYYVFDRNNQARTYEGELRPVASELHKRCEALAKRSEQLLITNPATDHKAMHADVIELQGLTAKVNEELKRFDLAAARFKQGPYLPIASDYSQAVILHSRATAAVFQIQHALTDYENVLIYLDHYTELSQVLDDKLAAFNAITDLNALAGSTNSLFASATAIKIAREAISALRVPQGLDEVRSESLTAHTHATDGFNALGAAFSPPIDDYIYAAARQLETATAENEAARTLLEERLGKLPAIQDVSELPDKVADF